MLRSTYARWSIAVLAALSLLAAACGDDDGGASDVAATPATMAASDADEEPTAGADEEPATPSEEPAAPADEEPATPADDSGDAPAGAEETVELDWWMIADEPITPVWEALVVSFEEAHPNIDVELTLFPNEDYKTAIEVALGSDDPPDVFFNWPGDDTARYIRDGLVADLSDYADQHGWNDELSQGIVAAYRFDGGLYGLPWTLNAKFWFYNAEVFDELGLSVPETFDDLLALCGSLNEAGLTPMSWGNSERWQGVHYLSTFNQKSVPGDVLQADYTLAASDANLFAHPGYADALQLAVDLVEADCYHPGVNSTDPGTAWASFSAGEVAMTYAGTWALGIFNDAGFEGRYKMFPMPATSGPGDQSVLLMGPDGVEMSAHSSNPDEAALLLDHIVSRSSQQLMTDTTGQLFVRSDVRPAETTPEREFVLKQVAEATGAAVWLDVALEARIAEAYLNGIQEVVSGAKSPIEVVADIREAALDAKADLAG